MLQLWIKINKKVLLYTQKIRNKNVRISNKRKENVECSKIQ
jgi:hypothetical protein